MSGYWEDYEGADDSLWQDDDQEECDHVHDDQYTDDEEIYQQPDESAQYDIEEYDESTRPTTMRGGA